MGRFKDGSIFENRIDGYYCYAQLLPSRVYAFYDYRSEAPLKDVNILKDASVLFTVFVSGLTSGGWKKVGRFEPREELAGDILSFIWDRFTDTFQIYSVINGSLRPATYDECKNLEQAAVWYPEHIEDRIRNHYRAERCIWLENMMNPFYNPELRINNPYLIVKK